MTEQERFEAWNKSCEWFRDYHGSSTEEDILNFDEETKRYHYSTQQKCWEAWHAAQQKEVYQEIPDGYVLVPVKPTKNMINQGYEAHDGFFTNGAVVDVWEAMIAAAQGAE